jgi:hypothetical protein
MTDPTRRILTVLMRARVETPGLPPLFVRTGEDAEAAAAIRHQRGRGSSSLSILDERSGEWAAWRTAP